MDDKLDLIIQRLDKMDSRLGSIETNISKIQQDIERIKKFVAIENADFQITLIDKAAIRKQ